MWRRMIRWLVAGLALVLIVGVFGGGVAGASNPGNNGRLVYSDRQECGRHGSNLASEIFTMNPDGSDVRRLTFDACREPEVDASDFWLSQSYQPSWSPRGDEIAFVHLSERDTWSIRVMDPDGRSVRTISSSFRLIDSLSWSPDAQQLALVGLGHDASGAVRYGIWVVAVDGSASRLVLAQPTPWAGSLSGIWDVEWSPSGDAIAFVMDGDVGQSIHVMDPTGSNVRPIACGWETDEYTEASSRSPEWHPSGQLLFCDSSFTDSVYFFGPDLWIHDFRDGLNRGPFLAGLAEEMSDPLASPDGSQLLFIGKQGEEYGLWSYERAERIADRPSGDIDWQPIQGSFWDDERSVFISDIEWMAAEGITKGCNPPSNDRFCPDSDVTRGQMAAFLRRAFDLPSSSTDFFTDDDDSVFEADINALAASGITKGCNPPASDRFCPDGRVTREQMAAFMKRAFDYPPSATDFFVDDDESIFEADINSIAEVGVTRGCNPSEGNTRYCPKDHVTRGQMAAFLHRAMG